MKIRIKATIELEYDIPDEHLNDAFDSSDPRIIEVIERETLLNDGDYFISMLGNTDIISEDYEVTAS